VNRLAIIALVFTLSLSASVLVAWELFGDEALRVGRRIDVVRGSVHDSLRRDSPDRPLLVWLGDSTLVKNYRTGPFPRKLGRQLPMSVETRLAAHPGLTFSHFYCLLGPALALEPQLVVIVANLWSINPANRRRPLGTLGSLIPAGELRRAIRLPFRALGGPTAPELIVARLLRIPTVDSAYHFSVGLRQMFRRALPRAGRGRSGEFPVGEEWGELFRREAQLGDDHVAAVLRGFDFEIARDDAMVRMMAATVSAAVRSDVPVLVYVNPIPVTRLPEGGWYDAGRYARRIGVMREAVSDAGGAFVDLHAAVPGGGLLDLRGHLDASGADRMASLLAPHVLAILDGATRTGSR
jgi:hypothetical protein